MLKTNWSIIYRAFRLVDRCSFVLAITVDVNHKLQVKRLCTALQPNTNKEYKTRRAQDFQVCLKPIGASHYHAATQHRDKKNAGYTFRDACISILILVS